MPILGCGGRENVESGKHRGREDRLPQRGRDDEEVRPPQHRQAVGGVHQERARIHGDGVHALWRSQNVRLLLRFF